MVKLKICASCGGQLHEYYCSNCLRFDLRLKDARVLNDLINLSPKRKPYFSYLIKNNQVIELNLSKCKLIEIPQSIGDLGSIKRLDLSKNKLEEIPTSIGKLTSLESLCLDRNKLTSVPESIGKLTSVFELYLFKNQLTSLPNSIGNLTSLECLVLYSNKLSTLPDSIINLKSLDFLNIEGNPFTELPEILKNFTSLEDLFADKKIQKEWNDLRNKKEILNIRDRRTIRNILNILISGIIITIATSTYILINDFSPFAFIFLLIGIGLLILGIESIWQRKKFIAKNKNRT